MQPRPRTGQRPNARNVFEFYLFVNPIGSRCRQAEVALLEAIDALPVKTDVHILCQLTPQTVAQFMKRLAIHKPPLQLRNHIYTTTYRAILAYKAASLQGKRKGRNYLLALQQTLQHYTDSLSDSTAIEIAQNIGIDTEQFLIDFRSEYVHQLFLNDQKIANDMNIQQTPSLVIFEHCITEEGVVMVHDITPDNIMAHIQSIIEQNEQQAIH